MTLNMIILNTFLLLLFTQSLEAVTITDCSAGSDARAKLKSAIVSDCPPGPGGACPFVQGKNASIEVDFETTKPFKSAIVDVHGKIGPFPTPFPLNPNQACGNYGFDCPVNANESKRLRISLPILKTYPTIPVTVNLQMYEEPNKPIICIEFRAKITRG